MALTPRLRTLNPDLSYLPGAVFLLASLAVYIWALIKYGQNQPSDSCEDRLHSDGNGFIVNNDLYGFGIRLGIYLQWIASVISNLFLPSEWKGLFAAAVSFSIALLIALLLLTFRHDCAFTAEIIVVLYIVWGGFVIIVNSSPIMDFHKEVYGLGSVVFAALMCATYLLAFSTWFWHRFANYGEVDYLPTPGGTSYFLFGKMHADNYSAKKFLEVTCFYISAVCLVTVIVLAPTTFIMSFMEMRNGSEQKVEEEHDHESQPDVGPEKPPNKGAEQPPQSLASVDEMTTASNGIRSRQNNPAPTARASTSSHSVRNNESAAHDATSQTSSTAQDGECSNDNAASSEKLPKTCRRRWTHIAPIIRAIIGTVTSTWVILAIELTLSWNSVSDIYDVTSTGQIIPLVIGGGLMVQTFWKMRWLAMNKIKNYNVAHIPDDPESGKIEIATASGGSAEANNCPVKEPISAKESAQKPEAGAEKPKQMDKLLEKQS